MFRLLVRRLPSQLPAVKLGRRSGSKFHAGESSRYPLPHGLARGGGPPGELGKRPTRAWSVIGVTKSEPSRPQMGP